MNTVRTNLSTDWVFYPSKASVFLRAGCAFAAYSVLPSETPECGSSVCFPALLFRVWALGVWRFPLICFYCISLSSAAPLSRAVHLGTSPVARWPRCQTGRGVRGALLRALRLRPLAGTRGWAPRPPRTVTKSTPLGTPPCWRGVLCLSHPAVPLRPAPESQNLTKMYAKAKTPMKMFSEFSSCMTHMASAINTIPRVSKKSLKGNFWIGFQIITSPCFILSWLHYLLHRVSSSLMGDDSSLLLMIFYKPFLFMKCVF